MDYWEPDDYEDATALSSHKSERTEYMKIVDSSLRLSKSAYHRAVDRFRELF
jgi:hypothetical protein